MVPKNGSNFVEEILRYIRSKCNVRNKRNQNGAHQNLRVTAVMASRAMRACAQLLRDFMRGMVSQEQDAAEYDAWFRREVQTALAEANAPATQWMSNETVERESAAWRRRVLAGIEGQR